MYTTIEQFQNDWKFESASTVKLFENLTDESLAQKITPDGRSLGFLAWHIVQTSPKWSGRLDWEIWRSGFDSEITEISSRITKAFKNASDTLVEQLKITGQMILWKLKTICMGKNGRKEWLSLLWYFIRRITEVRWQFWWDRAGLKVTGFMVLRKKNGKPMGMKALE